MIVVDTGERARVSEPGYFPRWHPFFRFAVREQVQPAKEIGPQLEQLGILPSDVRRVVMTHLHTGYLMGMPDDAHLPESDRSAPEQPPEALTAHDWSAGVDLEGSGDLRAAISNAMVGLKKRFYGKGPERARTYLNDSYVFCAMEGGLTRNEQTLVEAGEEDAVRNYRLLFQKVMDRPTIEAVEQLTGRHVIGYHSQLTFNPMRSFEIFVLDSTLEWRQPDNRRA